MPLPRSKNSAIVTVIAGALAVACGGAKGDAADATKAPTLDVVVLSGPDMNERRPCYVVVRTVDESTFLEESYSAVAGKVFAHDPTVIRADVIFPGKEKRLPIPRPASGSLAVYVLFTRPQGEWKQIVSGPFPSQLSFQLESSALPPPIRR